MTGQAEQSRSLVLDRAPTDRYNPALPDFDEDLKTIRDIVIILILGLLSSSLHAQIGNDWINFDQEYWEIPVSEDGWYRIDYQTLANAGFPVSTVDPRNIQMIGREKEIMIVVSGEDDGTFNPIDFIEFYGERNDGWLDELIYDDEEHQANPHYSLFNDTIHYFITINNSFDNERIETISENNYDDYTAQSYCRTTSIMSLTNEYLIGRQDLNGVSLPWYEEAEGWFDNRFSIGQQRDHDVPTPNAYQSGDAPSAQVMAVSASASLAQGTFNHHLQVGWGNEFNQIVDTIYHGYQLNTFNFSIEAENIGELTRVSHRSVNDLEVASDWHAVGRIEIDYARDFDFSGGESHRFVVENTFDQTEAYCHIENVITDARLHVMMNGFIQAIETQLVGADLNAIIPFFLNPDEAELLLSYESDIQNVTSIEKVMGSGFFTDFEGIELDSALLVISDEELMPAAGNYGFYRESQGMDVLLIDVAELYLQYGGGIDKHPLSIRRFCDDLLQNWMSKPAHLFIIGKSIHEMDISATPGARNNPELYAANHVPTWGWPASDLPFTSGLDGTLTEPAIPTGRLAAKHQDHVLDYLNKVVEFESQPAAEWMKNVLHFGGGGNEYEQGLFKNYLEEYRTILEDTCFGGIAHSFYKSTTDPIQLNLSDSINLLINEGASLMTFFGHASSTGFDQNIDSPSSYDNQGKYPLLVGNSCYTGNIHLGSGLSTSEEFVLADQRGVIGFIAKGDLGAPAYLNMFTLNFYKRLFQKNYGGTIGQAMKGSVQDFQTNLADDLRVNTALTFGLHGDPSLRLNAHAAPDYKIEASSIFFEPSEVTAQIDSFDVKIEIVNIGKAIDQSFGIELIRYLPGGIDTSISLDISQLYFRDTVSFRLPVDRANGIGLNTFDVFVDYPALLVPELEDVANNIVQGHELLITSGDLIPVYPYEFAVLPFDDITLKASTGFPFLDERTYIFELDTTDTFDSPLKQTHVVSQSGGVVEWPLENPLVDERVYYWRTSADSVDETGFNWFESSFQYWSGEKGWGQAHFYQFEENKFNRLNYDRDLRLMEFETNELELKCQVYGNPSTNFEVLGTRYQIDLEVMDYAGCGITPALMVAVIDSASLEPWESNYNDENPDYDFGNLLSCANDRGRAERYFIFRQNVESELQGFVDMMNTVPDGNHVLIYTWQYADYDGWELVPEVFDAFVELGATQAGLAQDSVPFVFFATKGIPQSAQEVYGESIDDYLEFETEMQGVIGKGAMRSALVGPAQSWDEALWDIASQLTEDTDSTQIKVHGVKPGGDEDELFSGYQDPAGIQTLGDYIDHEIYPWLRLEAEVHDFDNQNAPQVESWHVVYSAAPEVAINPHLHSVFEMDTMQEGQDLLFSVAIENIGTVTTDSLLVSYWIEDRNRVRHSLAYERQAAMAPGDVLIDTIMASTTGFGGDNILWVEVNPVDPETGTYDQIEQYHFNNLAQKRFIVIEDDINPILDVTFDGIHILNGEIVSAEPNILISLDDENQFFVLDEESDTASFKLFLSTPDVVQRPIYFTNPDINWIPADLPANKFRVEYRPTFTDDGEYELLVQAADKSGNSSGNVDYRIEFEIFSKPTITEILNYPNPFSTRTQFVFTLTGTTPPDDVMIQIMTIGGRVVREITSVELGPLNIGRNFSNFWWDGTDQYGDPLANGVYLYRVKARLNGQDVELRQTEASQYFHKGYGKMYLLR